MGWVMRSIITKYVNQALPLTFAGVICILPEAAIAADAKLNGANSAWILTATALVLFMTLPGLALFYGGLVQAKNVLSVFMHCFTIACFASVYGCLVFTRLPLMTGVT